MKKNIFKYKASLVISCFLIMSTTVLKSQTDRSLDYYMRGNKAFADKNYSVADSLFTLSIDLKPHLDTYFNRAACRKKLKNYNGYCMDIQTAAALGDKEAKELYEAECLKQQSVFNNDNNQSCELIGNYDRIKINTKKDTLTTYCLKGKDTTFTTSSDVVLPEFPGGQKAFHTYISTNMSYPASAREAGLSGKVFIRFTIEKDGKITNVTLLKGVQGCYDCDREAMHVISSMQNWIPGKNKDQPIKFYYTLSLNFKIQ